MACLPHTLVPMLQSNGLLSLRGSAHPQLSMHMHARDSMPSLGWERVVHTSVIQWTWCHGPQGHRAWSGGKHVTRVPSARVPIGLSFKAMVGLWDKSTYTLWQLDASAEGADFNFVAFGCHQITTR